MACDYFWVVTAFDAADTPLASSDSNPELTNTRFAFQDSDLWMVGVYDEVRTWGFTIQNKRLPWCHIPTRTEIQGGRVVIDWLTHPLAASYSLVIRRSGGDLVSGMPWDYPFSGSFGVKLDGMPDLPSLPVLRTGYIYTWSIVARAADGGILAAGRDGIDARSR
jgi:hypothetical protein